MRRGLAFLILVLSSFLLVACAQYDSLVTKDQVVQQRWADVEAQLQRRADLVPNLVAVVKGSAAHEHATLKDVIEARAAATQIKLSVDDLEDPAKMAAFQQAQDKLKGALSRLLVVQEQYPDLKANAQFHDLMVELEGTENRILRAREQFNLAVGDYNAELSHVRGAVVNRVTGRPFHARAYFTASPGAQTAPSVAF
jgi:LemA protein